MSSIGVTEAAVATDQKEQAEGVAEPAEAGARPIRVKRSKYALLFSYCGFGYHGLQRNRGFDTVEEQVLIALRDTKLITDEEFERPNLLYFQRAARTDKGVSAAVQVLSTTLPQTASGEVDRLNEVLPDQIKILGVIKTTRFFDSKNFCDGRTYSYMMPSFTIAPPDVLTTSSFRADAKLIEELNSLLAIFRGTHNFHNFTSEKKATDASAMRYILSIEAGQPFMKDGLEVIIVQIRGQSFMLHQIRKMMGMVIAVMRGFATVDRLKQSFLIDRIDVPRAPGLGLMLEDVHYDKYNQKFGGDGVHEPISWSRWSDRVAEFKEKVIHPVMIETEKKEGSMLRWLETLPLHTYDTRAPSDVPDRRATAYARAFLNVKEDAVAEEEAAEEQENGDDAAGDEDGEPENDATEKEAKVVAKKARTS